MTATAGITWHTRAYRELTTPLARVIGPRTAKPFEALRVTTLGDLMRHVPRRYLSGTQTSDLAALREGEEVALLAQVQAAERRGQAPRQRLEVLLGDGRATLPCTFFGKPQHVGWWEKQLKPGRRVIVVGKVGSFNGRPQLAHPDFVVLDEHGGIVGGKNRETKAAMVQQVTRSGLIGLYPATSQVPTWTVAECAELVLDHLAGLEDPLPAWVREEAGVMDLLDAFRELHAPRTLEAVGEATRRLLFDEAFATQLTMAYRRADASHHRATPRERRAGGILDTFDARLPFTLTAGQEAVSRDIFADLAHPRPMQRLLQGEVGSGKTIVALRAMLAVVDAGGQAALLAPTEVLAAQHHRTITDLLGPLGAGRTLGSDEHATAVALLTGSASQSAKTDALARVASGEAGIVVGTHALLSDRVQFADLGLVVVDEQHRFGVEQRAALQAKAAARPHVLVMTATPIPRSVAMTVFGDLELSTLTELPAGRAEVSTVVVDVARHPAWVERAWQRVAEEVAQGRQAFVVCPRITTGDASMEAVGEAGAATVEDVFAELSTGPLASLRVAALHGQLPNDVKERTMRAFATGELDVVVATTVIEVGVDVPNATVMVVLDADRFGISQLHQLRGRVGRGGHQGLCLLLTKAEPGSPARERLEAVAGTRDGFELAEVDLQQRREGDVMGAGQSGGQSGLRLLRVLEHADIISEARRLAERAVEADPERREPGFADMVTYVEALADADWMERT